MNRHFFRATVALLVVVLLQACSAGGGETGTGQTDTAVSVGVITGFGSVFVNGVKYETSPNTKVSIDGDGAALESNLAVGMLVTISGNVNADGATGAASSILFEDNVEGFVSSNDLATGGELVVLGQQIIVDNDTVFHSNVSGTLIVENVAIGSVVEVSGYSNGDGLIYATRIELKRATFTHGEKVEIKGIATNVSSTSFMIGTMTVVYNENLLKGFDGALQENDFVSAKSEQQLDGSGSFVAFAVELKESKKISSTVEVNNEIEFEGIVSNIDAINQTFVLNTETIRVNDNTEYGGKRFRDLADKLKVKIDGYVNENGNIIAKEVKFKEASYTYFEGNIEVINSTNRTITLLGVTLQLNNSTRFKDDLSDVDDESRRYFNFGDLLEGDNVEVSAYSDSSGALIASKLERKNPESGGGEGEERELEGVVSQFGLTPNIIVVSGVTINYENVVPSGDLLDGVKVEIHGYQTSEGWFATEIDVKGD